MGFSILVFSNATDLPAHLQTDSPSSYLKTPVFNFLGDVKTRGSLSDGSKLITKIPVKVFKPLRHLDQGFTFLIQGRHSIVKGFHFISLNYRMVEVAVSRVQGMVNPERFAGGGKSPVDVGSAVNSYVSHERTGQAVSR